jgi:hypothetical protein
MRLFLGSRIKWRNRIGAPVYANHLHIKIVVTEWRSGMKVNWSLKELTVDPARVDDLPV